MSLRSNMKIVNMKWILGQLLSLLMAVQNMYKLQQPDVAILNDILIVPMTFGIFGLWYVYRHNNALVYKAIPQGIFSSLLYCVYIYNSLSGPTAIHMKLSLCIASTTYIFGILIRYLMYDTLHITYTTITYITVLVVMFALITAGSSDFCASMLGESKYNVLGCHAQLMYAFIVNNICNEIGVLSFNVFSLCSAGFVYLIDPSVYRDSRFYINLVKKPGLLFYSLSYYLLSCLTYFSTIVYIQKYGIFAYSIINTTTLLLYCILSSEALLLTGCFYVVFSFCYLYDGNK